MSGFSADWLALREPLDARSRSVAIARRLGATRRAPEPLEVIDLGAGTGANLRYLAPLLGGDQNWRLVENDQALIAAQTEALAQWAHTRGARLEERESGRTVEAAGFCCRVASEPLDLARDLERLMLPERCLVTASALLDLVSREWLERLVRWAAAAEACCLFALTYDGAIGIDPPAAGDALVRDRFNAHQRRDKGFGAALGPQAPEVARKLLSDCGFEVLEAETAWRVDAALDRALGEALVDGWLAAAIEGGPPAEAGSATDGPTGTVARAGETERRGFGSERLGRWAHERRAAVSRGALVLTVGHRDIFATPAS